MNSRALTLAVRLLTTACAAAALGTMTGCPFFFSCPEPWSEVQAVELGTSADIFALTRGGDYDTLVAVGAGGAVVHQGTSVNGDSASLSTPVNVALRGVVSFGTTLVVGDGGTILSSPDSGLTWQAHESTVTDDLLGVARGSFEAGTFLVAIAAERVLVSTDDGVSWTEVVAPAEGWGGLRAVFATHDEIWVIGDGGSAWAATDPSGVWLRQELGTSADLIAGGRVSGDSGSSYASSLALASVDQLLFRDADASTWTVLDADLDGDIAAYNGGFAVTTNGTIYDIDESGSVSRVTTVGLVPLAITGNWDGFVVAGEGGNAARAYVQECVGGRPWVVDGELTTAALVGEIPQGGGAPGSPELAAAWAQDALYEHASVASFARAARDLMSIGAPAGLIRAALEASSDELEHARACFELASRHAGVPLRAGPLPLPLPLPLGDISGTVSDSRVGDPAAIAIAVFEEGCINESMAAAEAAVAAQACRDSEAMHASVLNQIAADEARHAALAWRTLRWLLERHAPEVAPALRRRLATHASRVTFNSSGQDLGPVPGPSPGSDYGRLSSYERAAIQRRVFAEMVAPLAHRMLVSTSERALA
ncbi:hypothetical protein ENSA5_43010 [Enhygromyxa salina]|uniref:Ferritin-like domain-containing protein n=1 Tax=Enhygromyxa salina TaxID=215803 RepID=A0A2S9XKN4_9BACT|nr:hypothetical protein [Enhygromyxa salina]PRP93402.1 hypothetical protein ENSA5_43010 [Enhygromyxa salina]